MVWYLHAKFHKLWDTSESRDKTFIIPKIIKTLRILHWELEIRNEHIVHPFNNTWFNRQANTSWWHLNSDQALACFQARSVATCPNPERRQYTGGDGVNQRFASDASIKHRDKTFFSSSMQNIYSPLWHILLKPTNLVWFQREFCF